MDIKKEDLAIGMLVTVNPRTDKTRKRHVVGMISEILTGSSSHPHGILVRLVNGVVGRVKSVIQEETGDEHVAEKTQRPIQPTLEPISCLNAIKVGENHNIEFKRSILWSMKLSKSDIEESKSVEVKKYGKSASKIIIAKTLAAFLNSDGGVLVVGVKGKKSEGEDEVVGINSDFSKLVDPCVDGYRRMVLDGIIKAYFPSFIFNHINSYIKLGFEDISGVTVCCIRVFPSDKKVFLTVNNSEQFFIRVDASTRQIHGEEIVDYCMARF